MQNSNTAIAEPILNDNNPNNMARRVVKINSIDNVTHDVLRITTGKPLGYTFTPGQATEVSINKAGWQDERRPFTFTSLPDDDYLEFTIKIYPTNKGVTNQLLQLKNGDKLIVHEVFGTIAYKGEGVFIAGGAGVTPFIAIFKQLKVTNRIGNNKLICANKTEADIILKDYFTSILGSNFINILSDEKTDNYETGRISEDFLLKHISSFNQKFYICGPEPMMEAVEKQLLNLKIDPQLIVKEQF